MTPKVKLFSVSKSKATKLIYTYYKYAQNSKLSLLKIFIDHLFSNGSISKIEWFNEFICIIYKI